MSGKRFKLCVAFSIAGLVSGLLLAGCGVSPTEEPTATATQEPRVIYMDCEWDFLDLPYTLDLVWGAIRKDYLEFAPGRGKGATWPENKPGPERESESWTNESWTITRTGDSVTASDKTTGFYWEGVITWKEVCREDCYIPCWSEPDKAVTTSACLVPVPGQAVRPPEATPIPTCTPAGLPAEIPTQTANNTPTPPFEPSRSCGDSCPDPPIYPGRAEVLAYIAAYYPEQALRDVIWQNLDDGMTWRAGDWILTWSLLQGVHGGYEDAWLLVNERTGFRWQGTVNWLTFYDNGYCCVEAPVT